MIASSLKQNLVFLGEKNYPKDGLDIRVFNCHLQFSVHAT